MAEGKLKVVFYDKHDKRIVIKGGDFTVWVDNDDVPKGAITFARKLVKSYNGREKSDREHDELKQALHEMWEWQRNVQELLPAELAARVCGLIKSL